MLRHIGFTIGSGERHRWQETLPRTTGRPHSVIPVVRRPESIGELGICRITCHIPA